MVVTMAEGKTGGGKARLSKNLLQMKFMKRTALKEEQAEIQQQKKYEEDAEHWTVPNLGHREKLVLQEGSHCLFEDLRYGRMSFRGFNPAIEKIMQQQSNELREAEVDQNEKRDAVSDDEMAERYSSLIHTMDKKFKKKRERQSRKDDFEGVAAYKNRAKKFSKAAKRIHEEDKNDDDDDDEDEDNVNVDKVSPPKKKKEFKKPTD